MIKLNKHKKLNMRWYFRLRGWCQWCNYYCTESYWREVHFALWQPFWCCPYLYWSLGLYCSSFNKTSKRCRQVGASCKKTDKVYPRLVEEKIEQIKSRSITFGWVGSDFFVCINICHRILAACALRELLAVALFFCYK